MKSFLFSLCFLFINLANAQVGVQWPTDWTLSTKNDNASFSSVQSKVNFDQFSLLEKYKIDYSQSSLLVQTIEQDPLGVFCKLDASMDTKLPFKMRFRLGEYHYTNRLEYGISY